MSLAPEWVAGIKWSAIGRYGEQGVVFIVTAVLAHLVAPEAFGIFGMGMLVVGVGMLVANLGTVTALVQRAGPTGMLPSSLFWVNLALGLALTAATFLMAPAVSAFFEVPSLVPVLRVLGASFAIGAIGAIPRALLTREMAFDRLAVPQLAAVVTGGAAGIGMALSGMGVWSLVAQHLVRVGTESVGLIGASRFRPRLRIDVTELRSVASFSINLSGFNLLAYGIQNADNLLIGKFLGAQALGYYDVAWRLIQYPVKGITGVVNNVLLPTLSKMQDDHVRLGTAYLRASAAIALLTFPLLLGMLILAEPFVLTVLGPAWRPSVLLVILLVPVGLSQSIGVATGSVYVSKGRTDLLLRFGVFAFVITLSGISIGLFWGLVGVAVARLAVSVLLEPVNFYIVLRLADIRLRVLAKTLAPAAVAAGTMALGVGLLHVVWSSWVAGPPWFLLIVGTVVGVAVYSAVLFRLRPPILHEIFSTLAQAGWPRAREWMERFPAPSRSAPAPTEGPGAQGADPRPTRRGSGG